VDKPVWGLCSASLGVLPCQYDFIYAHYSPTSASLVYNVVDENTLVAMAHHSTVDQAAVINNCLTLITLFNPETKCYFLID
jgi:hypothetical protein